MALILTTASVRAGGITGQYVEARTCDVWTGPCFAQRRDEPGRKHAVMGWRIDKGSVDNVSLDGLSIVAILATAIRSARRKPAGVSGCCWWISEPQQFSARR